MNTLLLALPLCLACSSYDASFAADQNPDAEAGSGGAVADAGLADAAPDQQTAGRASTGGSLGSGSGGSASAPAGGSAGSGPVGSGGCVAAGTGGSAGTAGLSGAGGSSGGTQCPATEKRCGQNNTCVMESAAVGCNSSGCSPCDPPRAINTIATAVCTTSGSCGLNCSKRDQKVDAAGFCVPDTCVTDHPVTGLRSAICGPPVDGYYECVECPACPVGSELGKCCKPSGACGCWDGHGCN